MDTAEAIYETLRRSQAESQEDRDIGATAYPIRSPLVACPDTGELVRDERE